MYTSPKRSPAPWPSAPGRDSKLKFLSALPFGGQGIATGTAQKQACGPESVKVPPRFGEEYLARDAMKAVFIDAIDSRHAV
jgi:hypothetical protein